VCVEYGVYKCLKGKKEKKDSLIPIELTEEATTTLFIPSSPAISRVFHDIAEFLLYTIYNQ
jgi:hypothetical protein